MIKKFDQKNSACQLSQGYPHFDIKNEIMITFVKLQFGCMYLSLVLSIVNFFF